MLYGIGLCVVCGFFAIYLGSVQTVIGGPMIGLFLGILLCNLLPISAVSRTKAGAKFSSKQFLKIGIILAGGTLNFNVIIGVGRSSLGISIFNICLAFVIAIIFGRFIKLPTNTSLLVGGGTSICGGTAIATLAPIIDADEDEIAFAMTAIFLFDIFAALVWPYAAQAMGLSPEQYGILGGLAINDTSSVTAAGATFDNLMGSASYTEINGEMISAGNIATIIKLTRTVLLVFVAIAILLVKTLVLNSNSSTSSTNVNFGKKIAKAFPLFVLGFLCLAVLNTVCDFSNVNIGVFSVSQILKQASKYFISVALVGVGYNIKFKDLFTKGSKPILLGGITWLGTAISTLGYIGIFTR